MLLASALPVAADAMFSPLNSTAYSGRYYDFFANPAALPMMERSTGPLAVKLSMSDDYSNKYTGKMSAVQNHLWNTEVTFISKYLALTGTFGSEFIRQGNEPVYNIYSKLSIELDMAYAFPHFSWECASLAETAWSDAIRI